MLPTSMGELISGLYSYSLTIVGLCVFIMFLYAGVNLMIGRIDLRGASKIFMDAALGTILLYSAYIILNSINHDLVSQRSSSGNSSTTNSASGGGLPVSGNTGSTTTNSGNLQPGGGQFGGGGATSSF